MRFVRFLAGFSAIATGLALAAACGGASSDSETPGQPVASASSVTSTGQKRVALTQKIVEDNELTIDDVSQLQLYLHGRIVLRREAGASATEITRQHTLRMVDGRAYDEVFVDTGTPGVITPVASASAALTSEDAELHVNFDPEHPEEGFVFEPGTDGRFRMRTEPDKQAGTIDSRREARRRHEMAKFEGDDYTVVEGRYAYIEIDAEKLHALLLHQRRLPGTLLPDEGGEPPTDPSAAPATSAPPAPSN